MALGRKGLLLGWSVSFGAKVMTLNEPRQMKEACDQCQGKDAHSMDGSL